jgi:hypothetical protein
MSDKRAEEKEELDYNIEWKVLVGKEPIISDIISRLDSPSRARDARACRWQVSEIMDSHLLVVSGVK